MFLEGIAAMRRLWNKSVGSKDHNPFSSETFHVRQKLQSFRLSKMLKDVQGNNRVEVLWRKSHAQLRDRGHHVVVVYAKSLALLD